MQAASNSYTFRAPTIDDLAAVLHIRREAGIADFGASSLTADEVRTGWETGKLALDTDAWLACAPDGTPVAYAEVDLSEQPIWGAFWVLPDHRGQGIEPQLLQRIEARARAVAPNATLLLRASDNNEAAWHAYEAAGYSRYLSFQIMQIDLDGPPPPPQWPEGITVRPFVPDQDDQATYAADEESALDKGYHDPLTFDGWAARMGRHAAGFDPSLWFLAWEGADLAGVALNYADASATGWVDHLGVRRHWRNRGLGQALLLQAFGAFYARGIHRIKLSVDSASLTNAPRLYAQVGMQVVQFYHIYRKELGGEAA
jgi:ribosomal protein S18 acetylase RimI-like enzyme